MLFCSPAYAEEVNTGFQNGTDAWDTAQSSNINVPFEIIGYDIVPRGDYISIKPVFLGDWPFINDGGIKENGNTIFLEYSINGIVQTTGSNSLDYYIPSSASSTDLNNAVIIAWGSSLYPNPDNVPKKYVSTFGAGNVLLNTNVNTSVGISSSGGEYLSIIRVVFSWILENITELITFILGNAFLAVGLSLFLAGCVVAFFVRVKRS